MIFCSECGFKLPNNCKFCPNCGHNLISSDEHLNKINSVNLDSIENDFFLEENYSENSLKKYPEIKYSSNNYDKYLIKKEYKSNNLMILFLIAYFFAWIVSITGLYFTKFLYSSAANSNVLHELAPLGLQISFIALLASLFMTFIWIVSIITIYFDAKKIGAGSNPDIRGIAGVRPFFWMLGTLILIWIIYPYYLYKRKEIWEKNL